jgi:hypothetical protein
MAGLCFASVGCKLLPSKTWPYEVEVRLKDNLSGYQVNLIGIKEEEEKPKWQTNKVDAYWLDKTRLVAPGTMNLVFQETNVFNITPKNETFRKWRKDRVTELVIINDLPPKPAGDLTDPRMSIIPFEKKSYDRKNKKLRIVVSQEGISTIPAPRK